MAQFDYERKPASIQAMAKLKKPVIDYQDTDGRVRESMPFSKLVIGECFIIPLAEVKNEASLRTKVSKKNKHLCKIFCVIKHGEPYNCYEVARIG